MVFSWFQGKCFLGAYTRELGPLNGINKLCQVTFQGYSNRFFFFFHFYPLVEGMQRKGEFSSSNVRESLDLGTQIIVTFYSTHIHLSEFIFYQADKAHPQKLEFSRVQKRSTVCIFLDLFKKSGCFFPKVPIFDL